MFKEELMRKVGQKFLKAKDDQEEKEIVSQAAESLGLKIDWHEEERAAIQKERADSCTPIAELAKKYGVSESAIYYAMKEASPALKELYAQNVGVRDE